MGQEGQLVGTVEVSWDWRGDSIVLEWRLALALLERPAGPHEYCGRELGLPKYNCIVHDNGVSTCSCLRGWLSLVDTWEGGSVS